MWEYFLFLIKVIIFRHSGRKICVLSNTQLRIISSTIQGNEIGLHKENHITYSELLKNTYFLKICSILLGEERKMLIFKEKESQSKEQEVKKT